jgi:nucleoside-diphosphate-sugar epimerase
MPRRFDEPSNFSRVGIISVQTETPELFMRAAVVGYGPVGRETARMLATRGDFVRVVQRGSPSVLPPNAEFVGADVLDSESLLPACTGVDAVVCCVGFRYDYRVWADAWPSAMKNLLAICSLRRVRLVFADNLTMYGPQEGPLTEDLPLTSYGRKPRIRASITRLWQDAHKEGRVEAVAVRASDFYGPGAETSVLVEYGVKRMVAGRSALVPYSPDHLHDFTYVPDFARAIVTLLDAPSDAYGQAWHVPNAPTRSLRQLLEQAAALIGVEPRVKVLPEFAPHVLGLFDQQIYELVEMRFLTDRPYLVDSTKFASHFWANATPFDEGLRATIDACRAA